MDIAFLFPRNKLKNVDVFVLEFSAAKACRCGCGVVCVCVAIMSSGYSKQLGGRCLHPSPPTFT